MCHLLLFAFCFFLRYGQQEALSRLKRQMAHKWEFIVMQAEEQVDNWNFITELSS